MSVIGIDFGNEACYVAVARAGGIETIANDYSLRATPSCVAFSGKNRVLGVAAKQQMVTNMKNTIHGFKRLLGRKFNDPFVQHELQFFPFKVSQESNGSIGIKVNYLDEEHTFSPEQITAMLFTKLKDVSETALKTKVNDCVISVPSYFTNAERKALLDAAAISGLNVLRLMNESAATALSYGIYKQDLPAPEEKPRNVIFVDCGHASLQVFACSFNKGKLKMLACCADPQLGGREFDLILAEHFCNDFLARYRINPKQNSRAYLRLLTEVEKLKKQMSANSTKLPMNIECFMDDKDVHGDMRRSDMEQMCNGLLQRVDKTLRQCLEESRLRLEDIYSVEIVGGSSRIPAIKSLIESVFRKVPSTTLNQDEAVARGCALQCAMLSPAIRVRDFSVTDVQNFAVKLVWDASSGEEGDPENEVLLYRDPETEQEIENIGTREMEVFPKNHAVPFSKMLTFYRKSSFAMKAYYIGNIPYPDPYIGLYVIQDVKPAPDGTNQRVKVKARININGMFTISSAVLVEKREAMEQDSQENVEPMDTDTQKTEEEQQSAPQASDTSQQNHINAEDDGENQNANNETSQKKKKSSSKSVDLPIEVHNPGYSRQEVNLYMELEGKMIANDRREKERVDARNALEEYVYDLRNRISAEDDLAQFVVENDRLSLCNQLDSMENWLYEEGEECARQIYADKLDSLKKLGEPLKNRKQEFEFLPVVIEELASVLQLTQKAVDRYRSGDEQYSHLAPEDIQKVQQAVQNTFSWLEDKRVELAKISKTQNLPITVAQIQQEKQTFENTVHPILSKPKPKVEPPPTTNGAANNDAGGKKEGQGDAKNSEGSNNQEDKMDVE